MIKSLMIDMYVCSPYVNPVRIKPYLFRLKRIRVCKSEKLKLLIITTGK